MCKVELYEYARGADSLSTGGGLSRVLNEPEPEPASQPARISQPRRQASKHCSQQSTGPQGEWAHTFSSTREREREAEGRNSTPDRRP